MWRQLEEEATAFVRELVVLYDKRNETEALSEHWADGASWFKPWENECEEGLKAVALSDTCCLVYGILRAGSKDCEPAAEDVRATLVVRKEQGCMKLLHLHFSHADKADGTLSGEPDMMGQQLRNVMQNIPGGVYQVTNDPNFTLLSMSEGFLSMFGYTREEVKMLFQDRFIDMIYPGDRAGMLKNSYEQLRTGNFIELEYRVMCKDGRPVWVLDKGRLIDDGSGMACFYCILVDITERKREQEELRLSLERHKVIMDQAADIIFEWDIRKDTLEFSPNWIKKFGYEALSRDVSSKIPLSANIHKADIAAFVRLMQDVASGIPYSETEFRIREKKGRYLWCRIRASAQYDRDGRPIKAVGVIVDIDAEKKQKQALLDQAQRDALTGLYNKAAVNSLVEQKMQDAAMEGSQALMIIDVDNFKAVNDTYGHLCGDSVLSDVAAVLKKSIRGTDLAGRIGGDEFLIYMPVIADRDAVKTKADEILKNLKKVSPDQGAATISCSIGVAFFPRASMDYLTLYKYADMALYEQKNNGRGGISLADEIHTDKPLSELAPVSAVNTSIDFLESNVADEKLAQYSFRMLYEAEEIAPAIDRLLEIIGRVYDVSRVYIFEMSRDGERVSITFEWCSEGVDSQMHQLQNMSLKEDLGDYLRNFNENGVFYCRDIEAMDAALYSILKPQGIRSMLQCAVFDEKRIIGGVGFDECRENRQWTGEQVASFKLTANVLATFLVKLRLKQQLNSNL